MAATVSAQGAPRAVNTASHRHSETPPWGHYDRTIVRIRSPRQANPIGAAQAPIG